MHKVLAHQFNVTYCLVIEHIMCISLWLKNLFIRAPSQQSMLDFIVFFLEMSLGIEISVEHHTIRLCYVLRRTLIFSSLLE